MTEYRLTTAAEDDLLNAFIYGFETFGRAQAENYRQSIIRCFELLADTPHLGRSAMILQTAPAATSTGGM